MDQEYLMICDFLYRHILLAEEMDLRMEDYGVG